MFIILLKELNAKVNNIIKKCKPCEIKYKDYKCCLQYSELKNDLIPSKWLCCSSYYQIKFDENLKKRFSNHDIYNCSIGVYPFENMDDWEKLNETLS